MFCLSVPCQANIKPGVRHLKLGLLLRTILKRSLKTDLGDFILWVLSLFLAWTKAHGSQWEPFYSLRLAWIKLYLNNIIMSSIIFQEAERQLDKVGESRQDSEITASEYTSRGFECCLDRNFGKNRSASANCLGILKSKSIQTLLCGLPLLRIELMFRYIWKNAIEFPSGPCMEKVNQQER